MSAKELVMLMEAPAPLWVLLPSGRYVQVRNAVRRERNPAEYGGHVRSRFQSRRKRVRRDGMPTGAVNPDASYSSRHAVQPQFQADSWRCLLSAAANDAGRKKKPPRPVHAASTRTRSGAEAT
ncbi:hypothetical protein ABA31_06730 [Agrococcus baldri]|uniref:Uncharacterized protein n=1 Tax=Agrococcus baldri TaxID=153730 RepID=A0AA87UWB5_9MICO|nr:hypothetical protein ABA31_06730 [Agrococcus baldri]